MFIQCGSVSNDFRPLLYQLFVSEICQGKSTVCNVEYIEIGGLECVVDHVARHNYAEPIWLTLVGKSVGRLL